jgi:hypothetical protein
VGPLLAVGRSVWVLVSLCNRFVKRGLCGRAKIVRLPRLREHFKRRSSILLYHLASQSLYQTVQA